MKFTLDIPDEEISALIEKKMTERKAPIKEKEVVKLGKKTAAKEPGKLLKDILANVHKIPSGSRRQGIRFKLGADHIETSVEVGLKRKIDILLAENGINISKACHAFLVMLLEESER